MQKFIRSSLFALGLLGLTHTAVASGPDIVGQWRNIDDQTGFSKAIIEITKDSNGVYTGRIVKVLPRPGYTPQTHCTKCTGKLANHPIINFPVVQNLRKSTTRPNVYDGGIGIDPLNGKSYKGSVRINESGNRLTLRGYIGVEALGRSQIWIRVS